MIVVSNTGNRPLFGISVLEKIPEGLIYSGFAGNNWIKYGNTFVYNGTLNAGESVNFTITFRTTKAGNFTNVVVVDSPSTNKTTVNNTTEVNEPPSNPTDNNTDVPDNSAVTSIGYQDVSKSVKNATGNPILVLLMVLAILGLRPLKGKK